MFVPYAIISGDISPDQIKVYTKLKYLLLYNHGVLTDFNCHDICRFVESKISDLEHVQGWFYQRGIDHSWLKFRDSEVIIDVYPVGGISSFMVTTVGLLNPWSRLYIPREKEGIDLGL